MRVLASSQAGSAEALPLAPTSTGPGESSSLEKPPLPLGPPLLRQSPSPLLLALVLGCCRGQDRGRPQGSRE